MQNTQMIVFRIQFQPSFESLSRKLEPVWDDYEVNHGSPNFADEGLSHVFSGI